METRSRVGLWARTKLAPDDCPRVAGGQGSAGNRARYNAVWRSDGLQRVGDSGGEELRQPVLFSWAPGNVGACWFCGDGGGDMHRLPSLQAAGRCLLVAWCDAGYAGCRFVPAESERNAPVDQIRPVLLAPRVGDRETGSGGLFGVLS